METARKFGNYIKLMLAVFAFFFLDEYLCHHFISFSVVII